MTIDQEQFRVQLLEERGRVQSEAAASTDSHLGEAASATLSREIDYTLGENSEQILNEIEAALRRIEAGTYGTCTACGKQIARERLEAYPWASLCIDDARKAER